MRQTPLVLYSAITELAYLIARHYYDGVHYVWCAPVFDVDERSPLKAQVAPTSTPYRIYQSLKSDIGLRERHSTKIEENRAGILNGAAAKREGKVINEEQEQEIKAIVNDARNESFTPYILIIPYCEVRKLVTPVPLAKRASYFSEETIIPNLPGRLFDIIQP